MASDQFDKWWEKITVNDDSWTTLERLAALEAWEYQQDKIDRFEKANMDKLLILKTLIQQF